MMPGTKVNTVIKDLLKAEILGPITHLPTDYHILDDTYYWKLIDMANNGNIQIFENEYEGKFCIGIFLTFLSVIRKQLTPESGVPERKENGVHSRDG